MIKFFKVFLLILFTINFSNISLSKENFYTEGVKLFNTKKTRPSTVRDLRKFYAK